jgi:hypothetical protein
LWLGFVAYLALVHAFIALIGAGLEGDPRAALFDWPSLALVGATGLLGVWLAHRTGLPTFLEPGLAMRQRVLLPVVGRRGERGLRSDVPLPARVHSASATPNALDCRRFCRGGRRVLWSRRGAVRAATPARSAARCQVSWF